MIPVEQAKIELKPKQDFTLTKQQRRANLLARLWKYRLLYIFLLPGIAGFIIFAYAPMYGLVMVFKQYDPVTGFWKSPWVGFENLKMIFRTPGFLSALRNTLVISSLKIFIGYPLPIIFALLINELRGIKYKRITQTISYLPYFISWVVVSGLWYKLLSSDGGLVNEILMILGILDEPIEFMQEKQWFYPILIFTEQWKTIGFSSILYLAAIVSIDPQLYESATIDGAGRLRQIWHITLPGIKATVVLLFIFTISNLMNAGFDQLYTMGNLAVRDIGDILDTLVMRYLMTQSLDSLSLAAAMGLFKSVMGLMLFLIANQVSSWLKQESLI